MFAGNTKVGQFCALPSQVTLACIILIEFLIGNYIIFATYDIFYSDFQASRTISYFLCRLLRNGSLPY